VGWLLALMKQRYFDGQPQAPKPQQDFMVVKIADDLSANCVLAIDASTGKHSFGIIKRYIMIYGTGITHRSSAFSYHYKDGNKIGGNRTNNKSASFFCWPGILANLFIPFQRK